MELPETNIKFVAVPDYQNSIIITLKRAIIRTSPYEPQLAHSTGLPKPPGYILEWSRVTPIRVTLVTRPPIKVSHHEHHLKLYRNLSSCTITELKPLGAHLTSPSKHWVQTAWRASHTARRHAPAASSLHRHRWADSTRPPGATRRHRLVLPPRAARRHCTFGISVIPSRLAELPLPPGAKHQQWPLPLICFRPPGGSLLPPGAIPVAQCYWFLALKTDPTGS